MPPQSRDNANSMRRVTSDSSLASFASGGTHVREYRFRKSSMIGYVLPNKEIQNVILDAS